MPLHAKIEYVLSAYLRPTFLAITRSEDDEDGDIQILVSAHQFSYMTVPERVGHVFSIIQKHCPEAMQNRLLIVQCYDKIELEEVLNEIFNEKMFK